MTRREGDTSNAQYKLRLFITGSTARSTQAIDNMRRICAENLAGRYDLEVVDVYQDPEATKELQIIATPTLVKILPEPLRRIIGDLSDRERVLAGLDLAPFGEEEKAR
ncbi:circadian clock KaiB family protein [Rhodanobacter umsongensis]|uniref:Circadian clock KaiB family protein n=1 Tax=Rhodanobacter umsongensis TaxID=633153 RepID=A0ABW0JG94_9GAMM